MDENMCPEPRHGDSIMLYCQICLSSKLREAKKAAYQRGYKKGVIDGEKKKEG